MTGGVRPAVIPLSECDESLQGACTWITSEAPFTLKTSVTLVKAAPVVSHFCWSCCLCLRAELLCISVRRAKIRESRGMCEGAGEMNVQNNIYTEKKNLLLQWRQKHHCCWRSSCTMRLWIVQARQGEVFTSNYAFTYFLKKGLVCV